MIHLEDFLRTHDARAILDIACGGGAFTKRLVENLRSYASVIGLDIKDAREDFLENVKGHDISFKASSIQDYITTADPFDTITVSNALHHLEDVGEVLKDAQAKLNTRGTFIVNEMHRDDLTPTQQTQFRQHRFLADLQRASGEYHRETWSRDEIYGFVAGARLRVLHVFENANKDAPVTREPGRLVERARAAIKHAYPEGAPASVTDELSDLTARNADIGSSSPPQLTLVCVKA